MVKWNVSNPSVLESLVTCKESWVYYEPESKRQNVQWKHSRRPDIIYSHWVSHGQIVNKEYYAEVLWHVQKKDFVARDQNSSMNLHLVTNYLTDMGIRTVTHPPYSPNIIPYDFRDVPEIEGEAQRCQF